MKLLFGLVLLTVVTACSERDAEPLDHNGGKLLSQFQELEETSILTICDSSEPGEQLMLSIKVVDILTKKPLPDVMVKLYHTNNNGEYNPTDKSDDSTAKLSGLVVTDSLGRILINTILPGDYGSPSDNRHIHTSISAAKPKDYIIGFLQYSNFMARLFSKNMARLYRTKNGTLVGFVTLEVKLRPE